MNSNPVYQGFGICLKDTIYSINQADHNGIEYFIALGKHSMFLVDDKLNEVVVEIFYAHILRVLLDPNKRFFVQLQLSDTRPDKVPAKINLAFEDKNQFVDWLKICWKTDHMFRLGRVADLPIFQGYIEKVKEIPQSIKVNDLPSLCMQPPDNNYITDKYLGYGFYLPCEYEKLNKNDFTYSKKAQKPTKKEKQRDKGKQKDRDKSKDKDKTEDVIESKITIQISQDIPLDVLTSFQGRESLKFYCEEYVHKLIANNDIQSCWFVSNRIYQKRLNLNNDPATWQGWEIHLRTPNRDYTVILLRRKYIPPLFSHFVDIFVCIEGPVVNPDMLKVLKENPDTKDFKETQETLRIIRDVADSFHALVISPTIYEAIIKERANCLLFDDDTFDYLFNRQNKQAFKPDVIVYGIGYLQSILKLSSKPAKEKGGVSGAAAGKGETENTDYVYYLKALRRKYKDDYDNTRVEEMDLKIDYDEPQNIWDMLEKKCIPMGKQNENDIKAWAFKIAKFFTYCLDGGILPEFTLEKLFKMLKGLGQKESDILKGCISSLLYICAVHGAAHDKYDKGATFQLKLQKILNKEKYMFNEKIMRVAIETGFIEEQITQPGLYTKFLVYLMETSESPRLKLSACIQIIGSQSEKKSAMENFAEIKNIFRPLMLLYTGDNLELATSACVALINLAAKTKDVKLHIMSEGIYRIILENLNGRDEDLLFYTLYIMQILLKVAQNISKFIEHKVEEKIITLMEGSGIIGVNFPDKIIIKLFQIAREIIEATESVRGRFREKFGMYLNVFRAKRRGYQPSEELRLEILNLCLRLIGGDIKAKTDFSNTFAKTLIDGVKAKEFSTNDLKSRCMTLLQIIFKDVEGAAKLVKDDNIFSDVISEWGQDFKDKSVDLLIIMRQKNGDEFQNDEDVEKEQKSKKKKSGKKG